MPTKILVTYASTHGSTQEIAERIAQTLRAQGLEIDLRPAREVRLLDGYSAVVLGAPLYMFHWHKHAQGFLNRFQKQLAAGLPIAIFTGGPFGKGDEAEWAEIRKEANNELARFPWLKPVSLELVGGRHDPHHLRFPWNLIPAMKNMPANDLRDWDAIRRWAESLPVSFASAQSERQDIAA